MSETAHDGLSTRQRAAVVAVLALGALAMLFGGTAAFGAARGTAFAPCLAVGSGASVHFLTDDAARGKQAISGLVLSGLDPVSCDGQRVTVKLSGNKLGDPTLPAGEPLAVLDSTRDPCTHQRLVHSVVVSSGAMVMHGCAAVADPARAAYVNIHDVTLMRVHVNGQALAAQPGGAQLPTQVLGNSFNRNGAGPGAFPAAGDHGAAESSGQGAAAALPFTGTWAALTFWLGLALVVGGLAAVILARRRTMDPASPADS